MQGKNTHVHLNITIKYTIKTKNTLKTYIRANTASDLKTKHSLRWSQVSDGEQVGPQTLSEPRAPKVCHRCRQLVEQVRRAVNEPTPARFGTDRWDVQETILPGGP